MMAKDSRPSCRSLFAVCLCCPKATQFGDFVPVSATNCAMWSRYNESASASWPPSAHEEGVTPFSRYPLQDAFYNALGLFTRLLRLSIPCIHSVAVHFKERNARACATWSGAEVASLVHDRWRLCASISSLLFEQPEGL